MSISRPFKKSTTKITLEKKFNVSLTILNFLPLNHLRHFGIFDLFWFVGAIKFSVEVIERDSKSLKKVFESALRCAGSFSGQKLIISQFSSFWASFAQNLRIFFICFLHFLNQRCRKHTSLRLLSFTNRFLQILIFEKFRYFFRFSTYMVPTDTSYQSYSFLRAW